MQTGENRLLADFLDDPSEARFGPLFEATRARVYTICWRVAGPSPENVEEAFQLTYTRLIHMARSRETLDGPRETQALLAQLAGREADALRKRLARRANKEVAMEMLPQFADAAPGAVHTAQHKELRQRLEGLVAGLSENERLAVQLHYFHGMTHQEIADTTGVPRVTVTTRLRRALKKLRPMMRRAGLDERAMLGAVLGSAGLMMPVGEGLQAAAIWSKALATATLPALPAGQVTGFASAIPTPLKVALLALGVLALTLGAIHLLTGNAGPDSTSYRQDTDVSPMVASAEQPESHRAELPMAVDGDAHPAAGAPTPVIQNTPIATPIELQPEVPEPRLVVTGRVTTEKGAPVAGASIRVCPLMIQADRIGVSQEDVIRPTRRPIQATTTTDRQGFYRATVPEFAVHQVYASADGHARAAQLVLNVAEIRSGPREKGTREARADIIMMPESSVAGRVIDRDGRPISGARVVCQGKIDLMMEATETTTDTDGRFLLSQLNQGEHQLVVFAEGHCPTFSKASADGGNAEIVLSSEGVVYRGNVFDLADGQPVEGLRLTLSPLVGEPWSQDPPSLRESSGERWTFDPPSIQETSGSMGGFDFGPLAPGRYLLDVDSDQYRILNDQGGWGQRLTIGQDGMTEAATIHVYTGHTLRGVVTDQDTGRPIAGAHILSLSEYPTGGHDETDSEGRYLLRDVFGTIQWTGAGEWSVTPSLRVEAAGYIGIDRAGSETKLKRGEPEARLDLGLHPALCITGRVVDESGLPVANAIVGSQQPDCVGPSGSIVQTTADGAFSIPLPPESERQIDIEAPGFPIVYLKPMTTGTEPVDLGTIRIKRGLSLAGAVVDRQGLAIAGATVVLAEEMKGKDSCSIMNSLNMYSDDKGAFHFDAISTADHGLPLYADSRTSMIMVGAAGFDNIYCPMEATLSPDGKGLLVTLWRPKERTRLGGSVRMPDGKPIADVQVHAKGRHGFGTMRYTDPDGGFVFENVTEDSLDLSVMTATGTREFPDCATNGEPVVLTLEPGT